MRIRTIAAALMVTAPLLTLESHQPQPVGRVRVMDMALLPPHRSPALRVHELRLLFACLLRWYGRCYGIGRGIARRNIRRAAYGGIGYRGGVGVRRGLGVGVGRVGRFR